MYNAETRSLIHTDYPNATRNSNTPLDQNADGSITLNFGPEIPPEGEANWVKTIPSKGFFLYLRFYEPLEPYFDKNWKWSK